LEKQKEVKCTKAVVNCLVKVFGAGQLYLQMWHRAIAIAQEEIFGPVLAILTFRTDDEVIEKANNSPYGLSAGVWTDKGSKIFNMTKRMRAGVIWANTFNKFDPSSPFGGYKESGYGREGGLHGLLPYLNLVE
jgi:aldehyde dehydrogenase (NAD+)